MAESVDKLFAREHRPSHLEGEEEENIIDDNSTLHKIFKICFYILLTLLGTFVLSYSSFKCITYLRDRRENNEFSSI